MQRQLMLFWSYVWLQMHGVADIIHGFAVFQLFHLTICIYVLGLFLSVLNGNFPSKISLDCVQSPRLIFSIPYGWFIAPDWYCPWWRKLITVDLLQERVAFLSLCSEHCVQTHFHLFYVVYLFIYLLDFCAAFLSLHPFTTI